MPVRDGGSTGREEGVREVGSRLHTWGAFDCLAPTRTRAAIAASKSILHFVAASPVCSSLLSEPVRADWLWLAPVTRYGAHQLEKLVRGSLSKMVDESFFFPLLLALGRMGGGGALSTVLMQRVSYRILAPILWPHPC